MLDCFPHFFIYYSTRTPSCSLTQAAAAALTMTEHEAIFFFFFSIANRPSRMWCS